jgi:hypothetical protein
MSQTQSLQVKLYSNTSLQYSSIDTLKQFMEKNYSYKCKRMEFKPANKKQEAPGKTNVLVVKNYIPENMLSVIDGELKDSIFNDGSSQPKQINELMTHSIPTLKKAIDMVDGVVECSLNKSHGLNRFTITTNDENGTTYSDATMAFHLGENNYPVEMKWFNNTLKKTEGRKTSFKLNKGDLLVIASEFSEDNDISITTTSGANVKKRASKVVKKKEVQPKQQPVVEAPPSTVVEETTTEHVVNPKIHRKILRPKQNGKTEKVWRKSTYTLKEGEKWVDCWKVNKTIYKTQQEALVVADSVEDKPATTKKEAKPKKKRASKKTAKKQVAEEKQPPSVAVVESKTQEPVTQSHVDETADINDDLPDELFDNLDDNDDGNSVTSSVDSSGFQEHEQLEDHYEINSNASTKSVSPTQSPVPSETSSTDEEDAEEIQTDDITASKELNPDEYEGESVSKTSQPQPQSQPNVVVGEIVNIRLALTTVPKDIKLCDENGEQTGCRRVFLLLNQNIKNLNIGKEHRIGNRVYGFDAEYPVYNVLTM